MYIKNSSSSACADFFESEDLRKGVKKMDEISRFLVENAAINKVHLIDNATFLAGIIISKLVINPQPVGGCGKTKKECNHPELFDEENCLYCD